MKDCFKVLVIKFLLYFLILFLKFKKMVFNFHNFFLKFEIFRMKIGILRLKLVRKRNNLKKLGGNFSILDAVRKLRNEINNVFGGSHV